MSIDRQRLLVFIPAYNCQAQIGRVLEQLLAPEVLAVIDGVLVADNRSADDTLRVASEKIALFPPSVAAEVVTNRENYGLGGSHKMAFAYAAERGFDYLIVLHGDDQAHIRDLLPQLAQRTFLQADCLLGARFHKHSALRGYSFFRIAGNRAFNLLFSLATGRRILDLGSGLNLYSVKKLKTLFFSGFPDDLIFNCYMLLATLNEGWRCRFFPISWREEDQLSNVRLVKQTVATLRLLTGFCLLHGRFLFKEHRPVRHEEYSSVLAASNQAERQAANL